MQHKTELLQDKKASKLEFCFASLGLVYAPDKVHVLAYMYAFVETELF